MESLPRATRASSLIASEREIVVTAADDEDAFTVFTDSTRFMGKVLRLAARWGVTPERVGSGWQVVLPLAALRFAGPVRTTERQREAGRAALRNARLLRQIRTHSVGAGEVDPVRPALGFTRRRSGDGGEE